MWENSKEKPFNQNTLLSSLWLRVRPRL